MARKASAPSTSEGAVAVLDNDDIVHSILTDIKKSKSGDFKVMGDGLFESEPTEWVSTGLTILDHAIHGGLPVGRVVEIFGREGTGKSLIALNVLAQAQKMGAITCLMDTERALVRNFATRLGGIDPAKLYLAKASYLEEALDSISDFITNTRKRFPAKDGPPIVIVLDSYAGLCTKNETTLRMDEREALARRAYLMKLWFTKEIDRICDERVLLIITNHVIANIGTMSHDKETTPGGGSIRFFSSVRLSLNFISTIRDDKYEDPLGVWVKATVRKNRMDPPGKETFFPVYYASGPDDDESLVEYLFKRGLFGKTKGWLVLGEEKFRRKDFLAQMKINPDLRETVKKMARDVYDSIGGKAESVDPEMVGDEENPPQTASGSGD